MAPMRLSGLASGLDTESMVRDIMNAEKMKVGKYEKERTKYKWKQEAIRDIVKKTHDFQDKYLNLLNPKTNIRSSKFFSEFSYSVTNLGQASNEVSISARASAVKMEYTIDHVTQLATKDKWEGSKSGIAVLSIAEVNIEKLKNPDKSVEVGSGEDAVDIPLADTIDFTIAIGRTSRKLKLTKEEMADVNSTEDLAAKLNQKIISKFGKQYDGVVKSNGNKLNFELAGNEVKIYNHGYDNRFTKALGIENGASSYAFKKKSIGELFGFTDDDLKGFEINGKKVELKADMTLNEAFKKVNKSEAGVELYFDSIADKMVMRSSKTGTANNIKITKDSTADRVLGFFMGSRIVGDNDSVYSSLFDKNGSVSGKINRSAGKNAELSIDGTEIIKESNVFTINGITFTLNDTTASRDANGNVVDAKELKVSAKVDADKVLENIRGFVDDYNELIKEMDDKLSEEVYKKYQPLTEEERVMLSEDEAKRIEDKAKSGILRNDRNVRSMLDKIKSVMVDTLEGEGYSLRSIGIASDSYKSRGKLSIDESKLKKVLSTDLNMVVETFTRASKESYVSGDRAKRYKENGIAQRLADVVKDFTRQTRDANGNKGRLVELAGLENDASVVNNRMSKELKGKDQRIMAMFERLQAKEEYYYRMFSQMEASMSQLQGQQNSMMSMLPGGGGGGM